MIYFSNKRVQKELFRKAKERAYKVLRYAEEHFNLKTLTTETNLKRVEALSERLGTVCKFRKFKGGKLVPTTSNEERDEEADELDPTEKPSRLDLTKGIKHFSLDASFFMTYPFYILHFILCSNVALFHTFAHYLNVMHAFMTRPIMYLAFL